MKTSPPQSPRLGLGLLLTLTLLPLLTACGSSPAQQRIQAGQALFDQKCKTEAGIKIYKTVENVEGIVLLKVRPTAGETEWSDPMWTGAAFARESTGDYYIDNFLWYENAYGDGTGSKPIPISSDNRGYISSRPSERPGYRYVDVVDAATGKRERYSGSMKADGKKDVNAPAVQFNMQRDPNYDLNIYRWKLEHQPAPAEGPRYGVTFEDHVIPEERALGLASSTVKVLDLKTHEVLGEMTIYAWTPAKPNSANPSPWLTAYRCGDRFTSTQVTRLFVDQILQPRKDK